MNEEYFHIWLTILTQYLPLRIFYQDCILCKTSFAIPYDLAQTLALGLLKGARSRGDAVGGAHGKIELVDGILFSRAVWT